MNDVDKWRHLNIQEWTHKSIHLYKNKEHSYTQNTVHFFSFLSRKNDMQEKETTISNRWGWKFPALGRLFLQYAYVGRASVLFI